MRLLVYLKEKYGRGKKLVNKPKIQGTKFETATVNLLKSWGFKAYRLAEGGMKDEGDVQVELPDELILSAKQDKI